MKTIFNKEFRDILIERIHSLNENSTATWGKMNVYQMSKHCIIWNDWVLGRGNYNYNQDLLGKIFGKMALTNNTKDDRPLGKNMPAGKAFTVKEKEGDLNIQKTLWTDQIRGYENFSNNLFKHDFFGKMTKDQIGIFVYKHNDHHLRQFKK